MKLSSLFPKQNSLTGSTKSNEPADKKQSLFSGTYNSGLASTINNTSSTKQLKDITKTTTGASNSPFSVKWPKMPKQQEKDYRVITDKEELIAYLNRCKETGLASFDWETAPEQETHDWWEKQQKEFKIRKLAAKAELESKKPPSPENPKKLTPEEKRKAKQYETSIKAYEAVIASIDADYTTTEKAYKTSPLDPWQAKIVTLSITAAPHESRVIFIDHKSGSNNYGPGMTREAARAEVLDLLEEMVFSDEENIKIAYNLPFETKLAAKYHKYIIGKCADPMVMIIRLLQIVAPHKIESPHRPYKGKSLKKMAKAYLGVTMNEFTDVVGEGFFDELSTDDPKAVSYSAEDSDYGLQLYLYFDEIAKQIPNDPSCPYKNYSEWLHAIEMPFGRVIGIMEYWGMQWNADQAAITRREAQDAQKSASDRIREIGKELAATGCYTNPDHIEHMNNLDPGKTGKTKDVKHLLFDILKLPIAEMGKTGPSLDNNAILDIKFMIERKLRNLKEEEYLNEPLPEGADAHIKAYKTNGTPLPDNLNPEGANSLEKGQRVRMRIELRDVIPNADLIIELLDQMQLIQKSTTLLSSHIEGREKYVNRITGRIHSNYTPWTATARLSSNSPNQQNVPRPDNDQFGVRNLYKALPGKVMTFIDFSGFELRLMAWRSGCDVMQQAFRDGKDLHKLTAATLTGKELDEVTKSERSRAKSGNFGVNYGGTEHALQKTYKGFGIRHSLDECKEVVDAVLNTYPGIPKYQREIVLEARDKHYVEAMYGYKRLLVDINHPSRGKRSSDERRAGNTPIQGSAAEFIKDCQNIVYDRIGKDTYTDRLLKEYKVIEHDFDSSLMLVHGHFDMTAQIHDEIIFEADNDETLVRKGMAWVQEIMERDPLPDFPVKIEAEASAGYKWGVKMDLKDWRVE